MGWSGSYQCPVFVLRNPSTIYHDRYSVHRVYFDISFWCWSAHSHAICTAVYCVILCDADQVIRHRFLAHASLLFSWFAYSWLYHLKSKLTSPVTSPHQSPHLTSPLQCLKSRFIRLLCYELFSTKSQVTQHNYKVLTNSYHVANIKHNVLLPSTTLSSCARGVLEHNKYFVSRYPIVCVSRLK